MLRVLTLSVTVFVPRSLHHMPSLLLNTLVKPCDAGSRSEELQINGGNQRSDCTRQAGGTLSPLFSLSLESKRRYGQRCKTAKETECEQTVLL